MKIANMEFAFSEPFGVHPTLNLKLFTNEIIQKGTPLYLPFDCVYF